MYTTLSEIKKVYSKAKSIGDFHSPKKKAEPTVIFRDYEFPKGIPCLDKGVSKFNFKRNPRPASDVKNSFGTRPNIHGITVIKAIKAALGSGSYQLHVSDGSYSGYSLWQVQEFLQNFDNTNLRVWIEEVFDCDDFSQVLQGNINSFFPGIPFGTIWYGPKKGPPWWGHSVNIFYSYTNKKVYLVEPQSNTFYTFNKIKWAPWMVIL